MCFCTDYRLREIVIQFCWIHLYMLDLTKRYVLLSWWLLLRQTMILLLCNDLLYSCLTMHPVASHGIRLRLVWHSCSPCFWMGLERMGKSETNAEAHSYTILRASGVCQNGTNARVLKSVQLLQTQPTTNGVKFCLPI